MSFIVKCRCSSSFVWSCLISTWRAARGRALRSDEHELDGHRRHAGRLPWRGRSCGHLINHHLNTTPQQTDMRTLTDRLDANVVLLSVNLLSTCVNISLLCTTVSYRLACHLSDIKSWLLKYSTHNNRTSSMQHLKPTSEEARLVWHCCD